MNNLSSSLPQGHWSSTDINRIIPLSTVEGQDVHIREREEREAWRVRQGHVGELDMVERLNYIRRPENGWSSRLLEWRDCLSEAVAHTQSACLSLFPLPITTAPRLCPSCLFSLKNVFFRKPICHPRQLLFLLSCLYLWLLFSRSSPPTISISVLHTCLLSV